MSQNVICPLCHSVGDSGRIDRFDVDDLVAGYREIFHIETGQLFRNDQLEYYRCKKCDLKYFSPLATGDEAFYQSLQKSDWYYEDEKHEYDYVRQFIKSSDKVLEVGCGKGAFSRFIECRHYTGLEFSQSARDIAKAGGVEILNESIEDHAEKHKDYDVVVSFQVLEHVAHTRIFLQAMLGALKPDGFLIVAVPSEDSWLSLAPNGLLNMPPHHVTRWSDRVFDFVAREFGLITVEIYHETIQGNHYVPALSAMISSRILSAVGVRRSLLETSVARRMLFKVCDWTAKLLSLTISPSISINGHTVVAVFRKEVEKA